MLSASAMKAVICVLIVLFVIIVALIAAILIYNSQQKKLRNQDTEGSGSFFKDFSNIMYSALFGDKFPEDVSEKIGINAEQYYSECRIVGVKPDLKKMIIHYILGFIFLFAGLVVAIMLNMMLGTVIAAISLVFMSLEKSMLKSKATRAKDQIAEQLPEFLDLLKTELIIGIPVEIAINNICRKKDDLLSREFLKAMRELQLGASDWARALESLADRYEVSTLTDFVMETTTAYKNGTSLAEAVLRKSETIKQSHLLNIKEKAGKTTNTILLPTTIFQLIPLIAFLMIPTVVQITMEL